MACVWKSGREENGLRNCYIFGATVAAVAAIAFVFAGHGKLQPNDATLRVTASPQAVANPIIPSEVTPRRNKQIMLTGDGSGGVIAVEFEERVATHK